jgi:hypothetical protein
MQKRTLKVAVLAALAVILVLSFSSVALADSTWSDLPDTVTAKYGITDNQVASISDGFAGGLWKPYQAVTRAQFTKMAVAAFKVNLANPATASFTDVPKSNYYYQYIEGAKAAGLVNGTTATTFSPSANITRQQAIAIVSRYIADVQGYDLATMYTAAEIDHILAHFGDAASISASLKAEVAFAYDMGITEGDAYGNLAPLANLTRIQGAAFLIRAEAKVPPAQWTAKEIEMVTADKAELLIGKTQEVTFKVTDGNGHPAAGVLVDFDVLFANPLYVGNISPQAAVTDSKGEVTALLTSHEPGTEKVSATIMTVDGTLATVVDTTYWVAMDECYILDATRQAENNAGEEHTWSARVTVLGPGPRSTSQFDWYNVIDAAYDPANLQVDDGVLKEVDSYNEELELLASDESMRTLPGIGVQWSIYDALAPAISTVASVGNIIEVDGDAITPAKTALGMTDDAGVSSIVIYSEQTGKTYVKAVATYPENPYPQMLIDRGTVDPAYWEADDDWEPQPSTFATATKTWIPHVIGGDSDAPITPAYAVNNTGEVEQFTLELKDVYGNAIPGYTVLWWIQGVGEFKTDDSSWSGIGEQNKDFDVTDPAGKADVWVKSLIPGQTIIHCKVMDKYGLPYKEWNVVKQWYSIDDVILGYVDAQGTWTTSATNVVNTPHTWTAKVSGAKYVHVLYDINGNGLMDDQALLADKTSLTGQGEKAVMVNNVLTWETYSSINPGEVVRYEGAYYTSYAHLELSGAEFMKSVNGIPVVWSGLAGKNVYFYTNIGRGGNPISDTALAPVADGKSYPYYVGTITSATQAVTDANGLATVTINSTNKGYQYTYVVADYTDNPQDGDPLKPTKWAELRWASATKTWTAADADSIKIFESGTPNVEGIRWTNPVLEWGGYQTAPANDDSANPNVANIAVQVFDQYGNALEGYKVTWEIIGQGTTTDGQVDTYHPYAHLADPAHGDAGTGDRNPNVNANPIWLAGNADGDYAWGYTLNHQINFTLDTASAANVNLVLDETYDELDAREDADHFTNIVNIKVYSPTGALVDQFEVTKVWTLEAPVLTSVLLTQSVDDTVYDIADITDTDGVVYYEATLLDQFGNVFTAAAPANAKLYLDCDVLGQDRINDPGAFTAGVANYTTAPALAGGLYTTKLWFDTDNDNMIDATELASNAVKANVVITPVVPEP